MDSWKSRGGKSQRGEEKKWEDQRRKKRQAREKVGQLRFNVFLEWFVLWLGGSKNRLAKAAGAEPSETDGPGSLLEVEMPKKCTPLWREAHFQVNMLKAPSELNQLN